MKKIRILIYEDHEYYRQSLKDLLNWVEDFEVCGTFENCNHITEHLKSFDPSVLLMDISMNGVDGLEGLKRVRILNKQIPVIMLTVFEDNDKIMEAICNGASGYLLKSTELKLIPDAIRDVLSGGAPMTSSIARKVIEAFQKKNVKPSDEFGLTPREMEVLELLTTGHSYKMIADKCFVSVETVRSHIKKIYEKLQVHSATEAAAKVFRPGL
ncbi:MAG: response regulator transcription factor [Saprospiraceae bacterium]|nr:response regulator transcription factor [Saprospiraceae bacterium]